MRCAGEPCAGPRGRRPARHLLRERLAESRSSSTATDITRSHFVETDDRLRAGRRCFESYRNFVLRYADLAEREHYDLLVLGTELKSATARDPERWRSLVTEVRKVFHGRITCAANWDEAAHVPFWARLDFAGVDDNAPIAKTRGANESTLCAAWSVPARGPVPSHRQAGPRHRARPSRHA